MPIVVKDYSWEEAEKYLYITVPLKGVKSNKVDIFSTETYVKVHFPPYLFESFLYGAVHDQNSSAQVGNGVVVFKLEKVEPCMWERLQNPEAENKEWQIEQRKKAIEQSQQRAEREKTQKSQAKADLGRFGVKQQMKLEESDRHRIEEAKQLERETATADLEEWKEHQRILTLEQEKKRQASLKAKHDEDADNAMAGKQKIFNAEVTQAPMRQKGVIEVSFTPRTFPTPSRESTAPEEEAWLKKQAERRRVIDAENADLSEEEKNPVWLRDKGMNFFKAGNYEAAINVFAHAIRLNATLPSLFSNRAACHLKLNNYFKCIEDSSRALELLTPPVPQNAVSRCKAHIRRGTAFCHLELYVEGLQDYEAALKIDPQNEQILADSDKIRQIIQTS